MENVPDILKKSDYEQNIEPNFVILIDKYKHRLQIRIKWIIMSISASEYFDEVVNIILTDFKGFLSKWKNKSSVAIERGVVNIVEFAEFHNMTVSYLSCSKTLISEKFYYGQAALMYKGTKNLLDEIKELHRSKTNIIQIELKMDLITRSCKIEKIVKY